jgi:hypothetical protein
MTTSPKAFEILFQGKPVLVRPQLRDPGTRGAGVSPIGRQLYWLVSIDTQEHWTPFPVVAGQSKDIVHDLVLRWLEAGTPVP